MKINKRVLLRSWMLNTAALLTLGLIISCNKNDEEGTAGQASLSLIHGAPGSPALELRMDGQLIGGRELTYSTVLPYQQIASGRHELSVHKKGDPAKLRSAVVDLRTGDSGSGYIIGDPSAPDLLITSDDLSDLPAGKAKVRFINLSANAGDLTVQRQGANAPLVSKAAYKAVSPYYLIDPAASTVFDLYRTGSNNAAASSKTTSIEAGHYYTLWAKGDVAASTDSLKLALGVIRNK